MEDRFSARQIRRRRKPTLINNLKKHGTKKPEETAAKLQTYAGQVLAPSDEYTATLQVSLSSHVNHLRGLIDSAEMLEREIAILLAQTTGAFLTSVKGIGIVLASGVTAEIGDPASQKPANNLVSYAGVVPRVKQTGGEEGQTRVGRVSKRSNHILKDQVVQSAHHIGRYGPEDLLADYKRRDANGQHADFGIARRYVRMGLCLMRTEQIYLPPRLRKADTDPRDRGNYYLSLWPYLRDKWDKLGASKIAFSKDRPLGQWRNIIQELYGIRLKLQ
jgi:transposase